MKLNVGTPDRIVRYLLAAALVAVGIVIGPGGALPIVLYVVAAVLALTATVRFCPLYRLFGLSTCPVRPARDHVSVGQPH